MENNLSAASIEGAFRLSLGHGLIRDEDTAVIFYDLHSLESRIRRLVSCFPKTTLHGLAIKANPLTRILKIARDVAPQTGVEAASIGEVTLALKAGCPAGQIVYDSPVKTWSDLKFALETGVYLNVDNFVELERVEKIIRGMEPGVKRDETRYLPDGSDAGPWSVGLRINPQVGVGTILESSVAGEYSKFGIPIKHSRANLEHAFLSHSWLTGVHLHVGSQGCRMEMLVEGIGVLYDFVMEINEKRRTLGFPPVWVFDIGGGLPISYQSGDHPPSMEDYVAEITLRAPKLFDQSVFKLITEFGRWVYTTSGWTVSRVEYVKHDPPVNTAMLHVGADLFVRECLNPHDWQHTYSVLDRNGFLKEGRDDHPYNLAGPLCFSGDIIARNVDLPSVAEGDFIVIHDTGGYTFSMWSRYNSRQTPRIIGYRKEDFEILKERETLADLARFWE